MDGVGDQQVAVGVQHVAEIVQLPDLGRNVGRIGVEDSQPVTDAAPCLLGAWRELPAEDEDGGRVTGAPLDLAPDRLAEMDAEPHVGAEPGGQPDEVGAGGDLPARVVIVHCVVAEHRSRERLRRPRGVKQAGRGRRGRIGRGRKVVDPAVRSEAARHSAGDEPSEAPSADGRDPWVDAVARRVQHGRNCGGEGSAFQQRCRPSRRAVEPPVARRRTAARSPARADPAGTARRAFAARSRAAGRRGHHGWRRRRAARALCPARGGRAAARRASGQGRAGRPRPESAAASGASAGRETAPGQRPRGRRRRAPPRTSGGTAGAPRSLPRGRAPPAGRSRTADSGAAAPGRC